MSDTKPAVLLRQSALDILNFGIRAAHPDGLLRRVLQLDGNSIRAGGRIFEMDPGTKIIVLGVGKASATMSLAVEDILGERIFDGLMVTKYGHSKPRARIRLIESAHPIPDNNSVGAAVQIADLAGRAGPSDIVLFLLSGGASSLMFGLPDTIPLNDIQLFLRLLLNSGMSIRKMNLLRKSISSIHAGRLARIASPAVVISLILSDVPGDDLDVIGSGPTVPDTTTLAQIREILAVYQLAGKIPASIDEFFKQTTEGSFVRSDDPCFHRTHSIVIGNNRTALNASADQAKALGYETTVIENGLFGESRERGYELAGKARKRSQERPSCLLAGGETAVKVRGNGRGGRNQELALAALCEMVEADEWLVASCSTDGEDGETAAAGAFADTTVRTEAIRKNMDPRVYLERNDSHSFFALTNGLIETGPSETNVMDIALLLTAGRKQS